VNFARLILICLIYAVPAVLLIDGSIIQGIVAITLSVGIAVVAGTIRQGEADFLLTVIRPIVGFAIIVALWGLFQLLPLKSVGLAHPIWQSAEQALGYPVSGSISIDPGATLLALGQYLSTLAVALLAAAVAVNRERAESVLSALMGATALVAVVMIGHDALGFNFLNEDNGSSARAQARTSIALGVIFSVAALMRTFERYDTSHVRLERSVTTPVRTFVACATALTFCLIGLALDLTLNLMFIVTYGVGSLLAVVAIRRIGLGFWGCLAIGAAASLVAITTITSHPIIRMVDLSLAFASNKPEALISITQRILADAPWTGTGAGTFAALLPIYQQAGEIVTHVVAPTAASKIAIELGRPMLWAIVIIVIFEIVVLLRGALQRGRDSFYPAAGASSLILLLLWSFCDNGVLGSPVHICAAAILGLATAQCKSRTAA
jgi:hypothetical protein